MLAAAAAFGCGAAAAGDRDEPIAPAIEAQGHGSAHHPATLPAHVVQLFVRHSIEGLRKTYLDPLGRRKDGMLLPRIIVFNDNGRLLGGQAGFRTGDMRGLRRVVHQGKPFQRAADLEDTVAELETPEGGPVLVSDLPEADVFVLVYRSPACNRCDRLDAELRVVIAGLHRHRFAWLVVDSDPDRLISP